MSQLTRYQEYALASIEAIVFDIDFTLVVPEDKTFYDDIGIHIQEYIMSTFSINEDQFNSINNYYIGKNNWAEKVLLDKGNLTTICKLLGIDYSLINWQMYDRAFDYLRSHTENRTTDQYFVTNPQVVEMLEHYKQSNIQILALSNCPENLSRKVLQSTGIDPEYHFDIYHPWLNTHYSPPKVTHETKIFLELAERVAKDPAKIISIGDNYSMDIYHANSAGYKTCYISPNTKPATFNCSTVLDFYDLHRHFI